MKSKGVVFTPPINGIVVTSEGPFGSMTVLVGVPNYPTTEELAAMKIPAIVPTEQKQSA